MTSKRIMIKAAAVPPIIVEYGVGESGVPESVTDPGGCSSFSPEIN